MNRWSAPLLVLLALFAHSAFAGYCDGVPVGTSVSDVALSNCVKLPGTFTIATLPNSTSIKLGTTAYTSDGGTYTFTAAGWQGVGSVTGLAGDVTGPANANTVSSIGGLPPATSATTDATNPNNIQATCCLSAAATPLIWIATVTSGTLAVTSGNYGQAIPVNEGSSAVTCTLPAPNVNNFNVNILNLGTGIITCTPASGTVQGAATGLIQPGQFVNYSTDLTGTNYAALIGGVATLPVVTGAVPTVACTGTSVCPANNAASPFTVTFTNTSAVIGGTALTWVVNEPVSLTTTGALPTNFTACLSPAVCYVNVTGLTTTTFQLCLTPPTLVGGAVTANIWTACTSIIAGSAGSGTQTATGTGNYIQYGGAGGTLMQLPVGTYSAATALKYTWPTSDQLWVKCNVQDVTTPAQMTQEFWTNNSCTAIKATVAAALDWISMDARAY